MVLFLNQFIYKYIVEDITRNCRFAVKPMIRNHDKLSKLEKLDNIVMSSCKKDSCELSL